MSLTLSLGQLCDGRSQGCLGSTRAGIGCKDKHVMVRILVMEGAIPKVLQMICVHL